MSMRRFTRLTNGFSKKIENHMYAIALNFMYYNFARAHKTLANPYPRTPAMAAGISDHIWTAAGMADLTIEGVIFILPNSWSPPAGCSFGCVPGWVYFYTDAHHCFCRWAKPVSSC